MNNKKKVEYIPQTPSTKSENDNEMKPIKKTLNFSQFASDYKENNQKDLNIKNLNNIFSTDEETKEKLENIRNNIFNIRQKVSSYSKIYDNISTQIESGITNLPKEEVLLMENKKLKDENLFYQNENLKLKNKINELENKSESIISKYKDKYIKEMKELEKIFEDSLNEKNNEINKLKKNQKLLLEKIEKIKETFAKEKEDLKKCNEEILNNNFELQRQIGNLYYNKWNNKMTNYFRKFHFVHKINNRKRTEDLETVIEEDKSDSMIKGDIKKSLSSNNIQKNKDVN